MLAVSITRTSVTIVMVYNTGRYNELFCLGRGQLFHNQVASV